MIIQGWECQGLYRPRLCSKRLKILIMIRNEKL